MKEEILQKEEERKLAAIQVRTVVGQLNNALQQCADLGMFVELSTAEITQHGQAARLLIVDLDISTHKTY